MKRWLIGLASGSSRNGVDAGLLEIEGVGLELKAVPVQALHLPYPPELRHLLAEAGSHGKVELRQISRVHRLLGEAFAAAARQAADRASFPLAKVFAVGCPGHPLWHDLEERYPSTLSVGMAAVVAERTGLTTVSDFRDRDLAAGGQGGPLTSLVDYLLFRHAEENRFLIHLGEVARIVFLRAGGRLQDVLAFESGPCNRFLDEFMRQATAGRETMDTGGKRAVQGQCLDALLQRWLNHPFLQRRPPKCLSRHLFGEEFAYQTLQMAQQMQWSLPDVMCTATHLVADGITYGIRRFVPVGAGRTRVLLSGGGTRNGFLWHLLERQLTGMVLERMDQQGIAWEMRKPLASGLLAALTLDGVPGSQPAVTGASGARLLGSLTPGAPANWARCLAWMASLAAPPTRKDEGGLP